VIFRALFSFLIFSIIQQVKAGNEIIILGGSGDPPGPSTIFDSKLQILTQFRKQNTSYKESVFFNGGHIESEKILKKNFPDGNHFSEKAFLQIITYLKEKKVNPGEKIIISIFSHGERGFPPEKSHKIHCGEKLCSLDELNSAIHQLESQGAKVAVIDTSCFSGGSLRLGSEKTCVMTTSPANGVSYGVDGEYIAKNLVNKSNKNLEEVFLQSRKEGYGLGGDINTEAGRKTRKILDDILMGFRNPKPTGGFISLRPSGVNEIICEPNSDHFLKQLEKLKQLSLESSLLADSEIEEMKTAFLRHQERVTQANKLIQELAPLHNTPASANVGMSWASLVDLSDDIFSKRMSQLQAQLKAENNETGKEEIHRAMRELETIAIEKNNLMKENKSFLSYSNRREALGKLMSNDGKNLPAESIVWSQIEFLKAERKIYDKLYRSLNSDSSCRSFSL
jgi:hypothetical protein